jgi:hypothetical protein
VIVTGSPSVPTQPASILLPIGQEVLDLRRFACHPVHFGPIVGMESEGANVAGPNEYLDAHWLDAASWACLSQASTSHRFPFTSTNAAVAGYRLRSVLSLSDARVDNRKH